MQNQSQSLHHHPILRLCSTHPRLLIAFALACTVGLVLPELGIHALTTRMLMAWCVGTCSYLALVTQMVLKSTPESLRRRARVQAETRGVTPAATMSGSWMPRHRCRRSGMWQDWHVFPSLAAGLVCHSTLVFSNGLPLMA